MSDTDALVFAEVQEIGPAPVAEIAAGVGLSPSTVRSALKRLEAAGDIESDNYQLRARVFMPKSLPEVE
jgi:DNA-binding Lrp family transcriptional regulator